MTFKTTWTTSLAAGMAILAGLVLAQSDAPVDDEAVASRLGAEGGKLIEGKAVVPVSELVKQLGRKRASFALPGPKPLGTNDDFYAKSKHGVLVVGGVYKCTKCTNWHAGCAGGTLITSDGKAVTNYHVVDQSDKQALVAMTDDGTVLPVKEVLAANKRDDVAIIQLDVPKGVTLQPLGLGPEAEPGSKVRIISHPDSHFYTLTEGIVSRYSGKRGAAWMQVTADYAKGSSGCPVLNERGQVVGMVASTESVYYNDDGGAQKNLQMVIRSCVPVATIRRMIRRP